LVRRGFGGSGSLFAASHGEETKLDFVGGSVKDVVVLIARRRKIMRICDII